MGTSTRSAPAPSGRGPRSHTDDAPLGTPLFLLNLKAYPNTLGSGAMRVGRLLERLSQARGVAAAIAPSAPDLGSLASRLRIPVLAQHTDAPTPGAWTGHLVAESIREAAGRGSLVNHSEHPLPPKLVGVVVRRLEEVGLAPVVCARDVAHARSLARFRPPYLAIEPPELIGGRRSVSTARPEVVERSVRAVRTVSPRTHVLCGAGIHRREDVRRAFELGSEGILVSSAITRSREPASTIRDLLNGFPDAVP